MKDDFYMREDNFYVRENCMANVMKSRIEWTDEEANVGLITMHWMRAFAARDEEMDLIMFPVTDLKANFRIKYGDDDSFYTAQEIGIELFIEEPVFTAVDGGIITSLSKISLLAGLLMLIY